MDLHKIITELQAEKHRLDEAILALERLSAAPGKVKRRGRPPRWLGSKTEGSARTASAPDSTDFSHSE